MKQQKTTLQQKGQRVAELQKQAKQIENEIKALKDEIMDEMHMIGTAKLDFDFGLVTIVENERLQIVDEAKVIEGLARFGLDKEYVKPRIAEFFNVKSFVAEKGMIDGITMSVTEYVKVTPSKD